MKAGKIARFYAVLAAALYAINVPCSKWLLEHAQPTMMAAATVLMVKEPISLQHTHEHEHVHTHEHSHGALVHTHEHAHLHTHTHVHDGEENVHLHRHQDYGDHSHAHA